MTSHPTCPGTGALRPGSSGWKKVPLRSSIPRMNAFTRSAGARVGCLTPYPVTSTITAATNAAATNRRVRTVK